MQDNQTSSPIPPPPGIGYAPRRSTRWWIPVAVIGGLLLLIVVGFGVFFSIIISGLEDEPKKYDVRDKSVLVLDLSGGLREYKAPLTLNFGDGPSGPTLFEVVSALRRAKSDDKISGVYIRSGGGGIGMAKLAEIRDALVEFRSSGKFAYAFIDGGSKSHYYLASAADSIFMPQEGMLEFNAFGATAPFMKGLFDKLGVQWHVEQFEEYKSAAETMTRDKWSAPAKEELRELIQQRHDMFVKAVSDGRKLDAATVTSLMSQGVYTPDSLKAHGLIDGFARESELKERIHRRIEPNDSTDHPDLRTVTISQYMRSRLDEPAQSDKKIAIVYASGAISAGKNDDPFNQDGIYSKNLIKDLRAAAEDESVDIIVLRIDSPGGSAYGSDEIWATIQEIRKTKPVYASMSDVAASGGYYIAMACDTIVAHPATITGSIGVIMAIPNVSGTLGKVGVTVDSVSLGASSNFLNPMLPYSEQDRKQFRILGEGIYTRFVQKVADSRKKDFASTRQLARGRVWTGEAARSAGLVDVEGGLMDAIKLAKKRIGVDENTTVNLAFYPERIDNLSAIFKMFGLGNEDDESSNSRTALTRRIYASIIGAEPAAAQLAKNLPVGVRQQFDHVVNMATIGMTERSMVMMPTVVPMD